MRHTAAAVLAAGLGLAAVGAAANPTAARTAAAAWLVQQQRGDGSWSRGDGSLGVQSTALALLALERAGARGAPTFGAAAAWLANADADSVDSVARKVEALAAAQLGASAQREADRLFALRSERASATWGGYGGNGVDLIDTPLALAALRIGDAGYGAKLTAPSGNTILGAYCALLAARIDVAAGQRAWPAAQRAAGPAPGGGRPSVAATALVLAESRAIELRSGIAALNCGAGDITFTSVHAEAQAWLLAQQNADGGFGEQRSDGSRGPSNVVVTAWVVRALNALAAPPAQAGTALNWLVAQQDGAGHWRADALVSAIAVSALPAATGTELADADRDGLPDVLEARLGSNPNVADARLPLAPPTRAAAGNTAPAVVIGAVQGQAFAYDLGSGSGFALGTGRLPPGLSLDAASGLISGVPSEPGSYGFDYRAGSAGDWVIARIDVAALVRDVDGDVPLPPWALALLGAGLAAQVWRRLRR
jgi:hypothetical protein